MKPIIRTSLLAAAALLVLSGPVLSASKDYYIGADSKQALEQAAKASPGNYAVNYFLGQIHLAEGNRNAAIAAWSAYLAAAPPEDGRSVAVKERMTMLKLAQAREFARKAAAGEMPAQMPANTIAVTDFKNLGTAKLVPFIKGLTAMIISDLAKVPRVRVLERAKIKALMQEMQLGLASGIIDGASAPKLGKMVRAGKVAWGKMAAPDGTRLQITSIVTEILENTTVKETEAQGPMARFFQLQKELVFGILEGMGVNKADLPPSVRKAVEKVHTTSVDALVQFGMGVDHLDNKDFAQAKQAFSKAARIDPGFDLAGEAETATPAAPVPVTSDGATEEVSISAAGSGGEEEEGTADSGATGDSGTGDTGDGTLASTETSTAETTATETTMVTDTTTDTSQTITTTETQTEPYPTNEIGWAVFMPDNMPTSPVGPKQYGGIYRTLAPHDANLPGIQFQKLAGTQTAMADGSGSSASITAFQPSTGETISGGLPYPVRETEISHNPYLVWGRFAETATDPDMASSTYNYKLDSSGYYVGGDITTNSQISDLSMASVSGTYSGTSNATYWDPTEGADMTGTFSAHVDFHTGSISNFEINVAGNGHTAKITNGSGGFGSPGPASFILVPTVGDWYIDGVLTPNNGSYRDARGSSYGSAGQAVGGIFGMCDSANGHVNGMFEGTK